MQQFGCRYYHPIPNHDTFTSTSVRKVQVSIGLEVKCWTNDDYDIHIAFQGHCWWRLDPFWFCILGHGTYTILSNLVRQYLRLSLHIEVLSKSFTFSFLQHSCRLSLPFPSSLLTRSPLTLAQTKLVPTSLLVRTLGDKFGHRNRKCLCMIIGVHLLKYCH